MKNFQEKFNFSPRFHKHTEQQKTFIVLDRKSLFMGKDSLRWLRDVLS